MESTKYVVIIAEVEGVVAREKRGEALVVARTVMRSVSMDSLETILTFVVSERGGFV